MTRLGGFTRSGHAVRGKWHVMGVTQGAGLSLQWFRNRLAPGVSYDALMAEAAMAPAGSQGLYWLPYLMGERTPHLDATARGGWIGLTASHRRAELIRSLIEGVSYSQKDCLEIVEGLGVAVERVRASGGGAKSPFWRQMLADVFDKPVVTLASQEGSALGAALLAMVGTGEYASVPEVCGAVIREQDRVEPMEPAVRTYAAGPWGLSGALSGDKRSPVETGAASAGVRKADDVRFFGVVRGFHALEFAFDDACANGGVVNGLRGLFQAFADGVEHLGITYRTVS